MKSKKSLIFLAVVVALSLVVSACAAPAPAPKPAPAFKWPDSLTLLSPSMSGISYGLYVAWSTQLSKDTGMKVRIVAQDSDPLRWKWMKQGLFFTSPALPSEVLMADRPEYMSRDGGPFHARAVFPAVKNNYGLVVRGDSRIKSVNDIKPGTKIMVGTFSVSSRIFAEAALAWVQVSPNDVVWVPVGSVADMSKVIVDGRADIGYALPISAMWVEAEQSPHAIRWIPLDAKADPDGAARFAEKRPDTVFGIMDTGVKSALGVPGTVELATNVTRAETDADLVYHVLKWLIENHDRYKAASPAAPVLTVDSLLSVAETDFIPLHDGSVKYLKELGKWTAAHEARRQRNIELVNRYVAAYDKAFEMADDKKTKVSPENKEWTELWTNYKKELNLPPFRTFRKGLAEQ